MICQGKGFKVLLSKSCLGLNVGHRDFVLFVGDALLTFGAKFATFTVPPGLDVCSCRLIESLIVEFGLHIFVFISWRVFSSSSLSSWESGHVGGLNEGAPALTDYWLVKLGSGGVKGEVVEVFLQLWVVAPFPLFSWGLILEWQFSYLHKKASYFLNHLVLWGATSTSLITWSWRRWVTDWINRVFFNWSISNHAVAWRGVSL